MRKLDPENPKDRKKIKLRLGLISLLFPFGIGASLEFLPLWVGIPIAVILGLFNLIFIFALLYVFSKEMD